MDREQLKRRAAEAALEYVRPGMVVGVGTGSTATHFIDLLAGRRDAIVGTVASSVDTAAKLAARAIPVLDMADIDVLPLYVDGADEVDPQLRLIKGGGGALTREKILASAAEVFVCIVDRVKLVPQLGAFPLPLEVVPLARSVVSAAITRLGGRPEPRAGFITDNGSIILDVRGLDLSDPERVERELDAIPGVVECGIFALRPADIVLSAAADGVERIERT
jgi:ribose 5-phosphate isomerase A